MAGIGLGLDSSLSWFHPFPIRAVNPRGVMARPGGSVRSLLYAASLGTSQVPLRPFETRVSQKREFNLIYDLNKMRFISLLLSRAPGGPWRSKINCSIGL